MAEKKLPKGIRFVKGSYEARAMINGKTISMRNKDLDKLIEEFEMAKQEVRSGIEYMTGSTTLDEWFDKWFDTVQAKKVKETSIAPISVPRAFGFSAPPTERPTNTAASACMR